MPSNDDDLFRWSQHHPRSYLRPTGERRRRCMIFEKNPHWDGVLKSRANARTQDPLTSHDAAAMVKAGDIHEARMYVDRILETNGNTIIATELREYVLRGIASGEIDALGLAANVRAESIRRRFSDLCP